MLTVRGLAEGRATTDEAKRVVIERLYALWCRHPEMRIGQLILNYYRTDFYMVEDVEFISYLEAFYQALSETPGVAVPLGTE